MTQQASFNQWDFAGTWGNANNASLPYLLWQFPGGTPQVVSGVAYKDSGVNALAGGIVNVQVNGTAVGSSNT